MATGGEDAKFCEAKTGHCLGLGRERQELIDGRPTQKPELMSYLEYLEQCLPGKAKEQRELGLDTERCGCIKFEI